MSAIESDHGPIGSGGGSGTGDAETSDPLSQFAPTTSAELAGVITNETGSGLLVFGTSPAITTPTGIVKGDVGLGNVDNTSNATERAASATLTNKTIALGSNTVSGTTAQFNTANSDGDFATLAGTEALTNKTIGVTNTITAKDSTFIVQDASDATKQAQFEASGITTGTTRLFTLPDADTTLVGTDVAQTLTSKTISGASNTVTDAEADAVKIAASLPGTATEGQIHADSVTNSLYYATATNTWSQLFSANLEIGAVNAQTGTTYTYLDTDTRKLVTHTNGSAIAGTLPQANASTFRAGWYMDVQNRGVGTLTITPTTSTVDGAASLALTTGQGARFFSDGTNYFTQRGIGGAGGGITNSAANTQLAISDGTNLTGDADLTFVTDTLTATKIGATTFTGVPTVSPTARTSGVAPYFKITTPADTGQTADAEFPGAVFGGDASHATVIRTGADGTTIALQRENRFVGPTYAFAGATTITDVATVSITPPVVGTNATFTRNHSLVIVDSTASGASTTGGLIVATTPGTAATSVGIGGGIINAGASITAGTNIEVGNAYTFRWNGRSEMYSPADGKINFTNDAANGFTNLQMAGVPIYSFAAPSISGDGTLNTGSKDSAGKVTSTATGAASIVVTFSAAFTRAPACAGSNETTANLMRFTSTTTTLTIAGTTVTGDVISYICVGY